MRQLAEQLRNNPQALARPLDPNTRILRQQDLNNMIDRMERLSRSGDKDAARQLLEQLQEMLENLQMAQPGDSGDEEMQKAFNELNDLIRKQQQLRDKTFKQGQDSRRDRQLGQQQKRSGATKTLPKEVEMILQKSKELREKTRGATGKQLEDIAQQQDALREQLKTWRESQGSR
jgi:uncharacterized protein DUF4175